MGFYETFYDYLNNSLKKIIFNEIKKFLIFSWMLLQEKPEWGDVELILNYFKEKKIKINNTILLNQIQIVLAIVETELKENLD